MKPGTPDGAASTAPASTAPAALTTAYTFDRWRHDLTALAAGIPTGFDLLDDLSIHWLPGRVYAVIARPGGGKTAFLLEAVLRFLETYPTETALFLSWEEPIADIVSRLLLREDARLNVGQFGEVLYRSTVRHYARGDDVGGEYWLERLQAAERSLAPKLARLRLVDGDELGRAVAPVLVDVARLIREPGARRFGLVAVDYFQKLRGGGAYYPSRQVELQTVSDLLRRFAKGATLAGEAEQGDDIDPAHAVPVLVAAQVTRGGDDHPSAESIREADDLANDAGGIIALSREAMPGDDRTDERRHLRVSVPKNRGGRVRDDEVARLPWRPARDWFDQQAVRAEDDKVQWTKLRAETPPNGNRRASGASVGVID